MVAPDGRRRGPSAGHQWPVGVRSQLAGVQRGCQHAAGTRYARLPAVRPDV